MEDTELLRLAPAHLDVDEEVALLLIVPLVTAYRAVVA